MSRFQLFLPKEFSVCDIGAAMELPEGRAHRLPGAALIAHSRGGLPLVVAGGSGVDGTVVDLDETGAQHISYLAQSVGAAFLSLGDMTVLSAEGGPWDGAAWSDRWAAIWAHAWQEIASYRGLWTPAEVLARLDVILTRAGARAAARRDQPDPGGPFGRAAVQVDAVRRPYSKFFALEEYVWRHRRFDGSISEPAERAVFIAADAVTVLPYDPVRDRVLLVEQLRAGPYARGDGAPWTLEPVAGRIDGGDLPEETAHREAMEEAGLALGALHHVASYYPSTGCFSEFVHSYVGLADLPDEAARQGGLADEGEDIRGHLMPRDAFVAAATDGTLVDAPAILTALWMQANLAMLRGSG